MTSVTRARENYADSKKGGKIGYLWQAIGIYRGKIVLFAFLESNTSKRQYKAVSHGVIKVCYLFGKAQSGKSAG